MKNLLCLCFLFLIALVGKSQSVIGSIGGGGMVGNMNINYTVGEAVINTTKNDSATLTQGFHQSSYVLTAIKETFAAGAIKIFPNPTTSNLQIHLEVGEPKNISNSLYDELGRSIITSKASAAIWQTDLSKFVSGYYLLTVTDLKNLTSSSFKIVKID